MAFRLFKIRFNGIWTWLRCVIVLFLTGFAQRLEPILAWLHEITGYFDSLVQRLEAWNVIHVTAWPWWVIFSLIVEHPILHEVFKWNRLLLCLLDLLLRNSSLLLLAVETRPWSYAFGNVSVSIPLGQEGRLTTNKYVLGSWCSDGILARPKSRNLSASWSCRIFVVLTGYAFAKVVPALPNIFSVWSEAVPCLFGILRVLCKVESWARRVLYSVKTSLLLGN